MTATFKLVPIRMLYRFRLISLCLIIGLYSCQIDDRKPSFQEIPIGSNARFMPSQNPNTEWSQSTKIQTSSPIQDVEMFYQTELPKHGWQFEGRSGSYVGYFYPNHNGSSNYKLVLRMSIGVTENSETVVSISQLIAYQGQHIGLTP